MKQSATMFVCTCLLLCALAADCLANEAVPLEVGGFRLGTSIDDYEFTSYRNYLKQVIIEDVPGFRKGAIYYGVCDRPGTIVKIKLKYLDSSKSFYKKLLRRFKKKFGEPDEYTGDSFGIVKAWKWHFTDNAKRRISLTLQHNLKNPDEVVGNMVKLSLPDQIEAERQCFQKACALRMQKRKGRAMNDGLDWKQLLPQE